MADRRRPIRARATEALAAMPALVSDLTAPLLVGIEPRHFREFLSRERVPHARVGHRVIARMEHVVAAIDRLAALTAAPRADDGGERAETADEILAELGMRRVGS